MQKITISRFFLSLLLAAALSIPCDSRELPGFRALVIGVLDGDTIKVLHDGKPETIRLNGIDCPEKRQAFGTKARTFTAELCFSREVNVEPEAKDRYGRTVAKVILEDGRCLNRELLAAGLAWWYRRYAPGDTELQRLEESARLGRQGLWSDPLATAPWVYRKQKHP
ncbi:MAG: thermonuclease family protein [Candidatus Obscuribacterales bacterium]|nr:thermonuclease family protein [Candidatus Obscuribacterales bacterium]